MLTFVAQFLKDQHHTGAILPSGHPLASAMTRDLASAPPPRRVLEVGPGTGVVTRKVLAALTPADEFHIVEINPVFCRALRRHVIEPYRSARPGARVELHEMAIERAPLAGRFDFIICSLPFNNFPPRLVRAIFRQLLERLTPGGRLTYFEYAGVRIIKAPLVGATGRRRLRQISMVGRSLRRRHEGRRELVLRNFPPAYAMHLVGKA